MNCVLIGKLLLLTWTMVIPSGEICLCAKLRTTHLKPTVTFGTSKTGFRNILNTVVPSLFNRDWLYTFVWERMHWNARAFVKIEFISVRVWVYERMYTFACLSCSWVNKCVRTYEFVSQRGLARKKESFVYIYVSQFVSVVSGWMWEKIYVRKVELFPDEAM